MEDPKTKIKILNVVQVKPIYEPEGKKYKMYTVVANIIVNGQQITSEVKCFSEKIYNTFLPGSEHDAEIQTYNGVISYAVKAPKKDWDGSSYKNYTIEELDALYIHAIPFFKSQGIIDVDHLCKLVCNYIDSARKTGAKIKSAADKVAEAMGGAVQPPPQPMPPAPAMPTGQESPAGYGQDFTAQDNPYN